MKEDASSGITKLTILDFQNDQVVAGVLQRGDRGLHYRMILSGLTVHELDRIRAALDAKISGNDIHTAGWMPGKNWNGTPYQAIFEGPAQRDFQWAALMFGLMVWEAFERHPDNWYTGKFELDGVEIGSRTYWRRK